MMTFAAAIIVSAALGGHLKTGHGWTLQKRPTELSRDKSSYTLSRAVGANFFRDPGRRVYTSDTWAEDTATQGGSGANAPAPREGSLPQGTCTPGREPVQRRNPLGLRFLRGFRLARTVECGRLANERLEGGLVNFFSFVDVDCAACVSVETRVKETGRILQRRALGEGKQIGR